MYAFSRGGTDPDRYMQLWVSWEAASKANKWLGLNASRWSNAEYDRLFRASEAELDPVKRAAMFIRMNDIACAEAHVIPVVIRLDCSALARNLVAPLSGWDVALAGIHDWYREA
jgi:peptide/nickel transport system substrate-binding protein